MTRGDVLIGVLGLLALFGGGCAQPSTSAMESAAVSAEPAIPTGAWRGTLGGRQTSDAQSPAELGNADLTIAPDGTFTLNETFASLQGLSTVRATGTARMTRGQIVLDGQIVAPEANKGEWFLATLTPRGDALYGGTDVLYRGLKSDTRIELGRVR